MNAVELNNVSKSYRKDFWAKKISAVSDLSFTVKRERVTGFVGPNGAGKTTTIKMIMGLVFPESGSIKIYNRDYSFPSSRKGVAYLSEQPYFYGHLTVVESLRFISELIGLNRSAISKEIERVLAVVELSGKAGSRIKELSKGMQQRLNMAQVLLGDPHMLILDEPMSGMDPPGRRLFRKLFSELAARGKTIFFSSHVLEDIEAVCDDVVVLSKGKLAFSGEINSILEKGFLGTEMTVSSLSPDDLLFLRGFDCEITEPDKGIFSLFVPRGGNPGQVQNLLFSKGIEVLSIVKRTLPLEELLYRNGGDQEENKAEMRRQEITDSGRRV